MIESQNNDIFIFQLGPDYFDDDLDDFIVDDDSFIGAPEKEQRDVKPFTKLKSKAQLVPPPPPATKSTPTSKPMSKVNSSGTASGSTIKTKADLAKEKELSKKHANDAVFSFLVDPKDVSFLVCFRVAFSVTD